MPNHLVTHADPHRHLEIRHSVPPWNDFLYAAGRLIATDDGLAGLQEIAGSDCFAELVEPGRGLFAGEGDDALGGLERVPGTDLTLITFPFGQPGTNDPVLIALWLAIMNGLGDDVAPDYGLTFAGHAGFFNAEPPVPDVDPGTPPGPEFDRNPHIAVIDVGFENFGKRTLQMQAPVLDPAAPVYPNNSGPNPVDLPAQFGHGESVAWLISRRTATASIEAVPIDEIFSADQRNHAVVTDYLLSGALYSALESGAKIITITAGGPVGNGSTMLATREAIAAAHAAGVLVIAAIGNDASAHPVFPAHWSTVLAVGALVEVDTNGTAEWAEAPYNNKRGADVYARGQHTVPFATGSFDVEGSAGPDDFQGWAKVGGTSFAVAEVAGAVAANWDRFQEGIQQGLDPKEAAIYALNLPDSYLL